MVVGEMVEDVRAHLTALREGQAGTEQLTVTLQQLALSLQQYI